MAEPLSPGDFATLLAQAGVTLPAAEVEDLRQAHAKLAEMLALLRDPPVPPAAEPMLVFIPGGEA